MRFRFTTHLSIDECQRRLRERVAKPWWQRSTESKPLVIGRIGKGSFSLRMSTFMDIGDLSFYVAAGGPACYGKLKQYGDQTMIVGRVGLHPILIAIICWFLFMFIGFATMVLVEAAAELAAGRGNVDNVITAWLFLVFPLAAIAIFHFGLRGQHRRESKALIEFLKTTLDVSDQPLPP